MQETQDYESLRAERDELRLLLTALSERRVQRHRIRAVAVACLVGLAFVAFLVAMPGLWAARNLLDTERFAARVGPLADEPAVQALLTERITEQVMVLVDPRELFEQALPDRGAILALPLANAVEGFVHDRVASFVDSDEFERLWTGAASLAHRAAVNVLEGDSEAVTATDDGITIDLVPAIETVLARITAASPEILGREIDLPDVQLDDIPGAAIERIESALDVELDDDFGQFTVYDRGTLAAAQRALDTFGRVTMLVLPIAIVSAALALWLSYRRRRTVLQLAVAAVLAAVVVRRVVLALVGETTALAAPGEGRRALAVVLDEFLRPLTTFAGWAIACAAAVIVVALVTGPYPWVVGLRARGAALARTVAGSSDPRDDDPAARVVSHRRRELVVVVAAGIGVVVLWAAELSWLGSLVVAAVVGACIVVVLRLESVARM